MDIGGFLQVMARMMYVDTMLMPAPMAAAHPSM
jgi:hypothetical protein